MCIAYLVRDREGEPTVPAQLPFISWLNKGGYLRFAVSSIWCLKEGLLDAVVN